MYHDVGDQSSAIAKEEMKSTSAKIVAKEQDKLETKAESDDMLTALSTT
jgi:hypothetical protein